MEAPLHQLQPMQHAMLTHPPNCKHDATATMAATDMACLQQHHHQQQQLMQPAAPSPNTPSGAREQCPRCASHDTKFCYYNNYNTSQPRHFCRACRRYWTLGGSLRNVPIGGSTRKRLRPAPQQGFRRPTVHFVSAPPPSPMPAPQAQQPHSHQSQQQGGLLGSLFALGGAPLLEGRVGFDLDLGLPGLGQVEFGLHSLGLRGGRPTGKLRLLAMRGRERYPRAGRSQRDSGRSGTGRGGGRAGGARGGRGQGAGEAWKAALGAVGGVGEARTAAL